MRLHRSAAEDAELTQSIQAPLRNLRALCGSAVSLRCSDLLCFDLEPRDVEMKKENQLTDKAVQNTHPN